MCKNSLSTHLREKSNYKAAQIIQLNKLNQSYMGIRSCLFSTLGFMTRGRLKNHISVSFLTTYPSRKCPGDICQNATTKCEVLSEMVTGDDLKTTFVYKHYQKLLLR